MSERPRRGHRRLIFAAVVLFILGASAWLVLHDDPPPDDSDLELPAQVEVPREETLLGALEAIALELPEDPDWDIAYFDDEGYAYPWRPAPLDREFWGAAQRVEAMRAHYAATGAILDRVDAALDREPVGRIWSGPGHAPSMAPREVVLQLLGRALWHRIRGDARAASLDLERRLLLAERFAPESRDGVSALISIALLGVSATALLSMSAAGELDPDVELRILARTPALSGRPEVILLTLMGEYALIRDSLPRDDFLDQLFSPMIYWNRRTSGIEFFFKRNRTLGRCAEITRRCLEQIDRLPCEREWPPELERNSRAARRSAFARLNSGELILDMILGPKGIIERFDEARLGEVGLRLALALRRHERLFGALPPDLDALRRGVPDLACDLTDPYSGAPLRYDATRRIFWSTGPDGVDHGGVGWEAFVDEPSEMRHGKLADRVWFVPPLSRERP